MYTAILIDQIACMSWKQKIHTTRRDYILCTFTVYCNFEHFYILYFI